MLSNTTFLTFQQFILLPSLETKEVVVAGHTQEETPNGPIPFVAVYVNHNQLGHITGEVNIRLQCPVLCYGGRTALCRFNVAQR